MAIGRALHIFRYFCKLLYSRPLVSQLLRAKASPDPYHSRNKIHTKSEALNERLVLQLFLDYHVVIWFIAGYMTTAFSLGIQKNFVLSEGMQACFFTEAPFLLLFITWLRNRRYCCAEQSNIHFKKICSVLTPSQRLWLHKFLRYYFHFCLSHMCKVSFFAEEYRVILFMVNTWLGLQAQLDHPPPFCWWPDVRHPFFSGYIATWLLRQNLFWDVVLVGASSRICPLRDM